MFLQSMVGYDPIEEVAWQRALENWPVAALPQEQLQNIPSPEEFVEATKNVTVSDLKGKLRVSSAVERHIEWLETDLQLEFDAIYLYTISGNPNEFIDLYGEKVIPRFRFS
jgi:hypothetical protein